MKMKSDLAKRESIRSFFADLQTVMRDLEACFRTKTMGRAVVEEFDEFEQ